MLKKLLITACLIISASCGSELSDFGANVPTEAPPTVLRIAPANASAGDNVSVFGFGFSVVSNENLITFGSTQINDATYTLVDPVVNGEIESLTFTVPANASLGAQALFVVVGENISNTDLNLTVDP